MNKTHINILQHLKIKIVEMCKNYSDKKLTSSKLFTQETSLFTYKFKSRQYHDYCNYET